MISASLSAAFCVGLASTGAMSQSQGSSSHHPRSGSGKSDASKARRLERGIRALVPFKTSPFPYEGIVPSTGKPFLDVVTEDRIGRYSARAGETYWADETYSDQRVLLDVPPGFMVGRAGVMVIYFHGNLAMLERDVIARQQVPRQVAGAGLNSVLIAPQFASDAYDSSAGQFWLQGAFSAFLDEASRALARLVGSNRSQRFFRELPLVLVAYSGGYHPLAYVLHHAPHERIMGTLLLDALYGDLDKFTAWLESRDAGFLVSSFTRSTADRHNDIRHALLDRQVQVLERLPPVLKPRDVVFLPAPAQSTHANFVTQAWIEDPITDVLVRIEGRRR